MVKKVVMSIIDNQEGRGRVTEQDAESLVTLDTTS